MHELSLTESVVDICTKTALGRKVLVVTLEIGELAGVNGEAMEFCFAACTNGTPLAGARLVIERVPGRGRCGCGAEFAVGAVYDPCPSCGAYGLELLCGGELRVKELEVD